MKYSISFWNLENFFDIEGSPRRSEKLERAIGADLAGWDQSNLDNKISQLSTLIQLLNSGKGPDILGVCEVENRHVLQLLVDSLTPLTLAPNNRSYGIVHDDSKDRRGIDVAFIYDQNLFSVEEDATGDQLVFDYYVMKRTATRDILQVNFLTHLSSLENRLVLIGNHWPSRSGGQLESEGYRQIAGETLAYFHSRIREVHGDDTAVLGMGDFNDEPFNNSLVRYALGLRSKTKVVRGRNPYFLNLMWPLMKEGMGSFFFNNFPNLLDQFLANENMLKDESTFIVDIDLIEINNFPIMTKQGNYPGPKRFGGMGKPIVTDGFSDHFPISVTINEKVM